MNEDAAMRAAVLKGQRIPISDVPGTSRGGNGNDRSLGHVEDAQQEALMRLGARASDWHSGNPDVRPGVWLFAFAAAFVCAVVIAALIGHAVNGDGSPFLN